MTGSGVPEVSRPWFKEPLLSLHKNFCVQSAFPRERGVENGQWRTADLRTVRAFDPYTHSLQKQVAS